MKIIIPGKPIPKMRARYSKRGSFVVTYDPQEKDKKQVRSIMTRQLAEFANSPDKCIYMDLGNVCSAKAFSVRFTFFLPINPSDSVSAKNRKLWGLTRASAKPDYDNLEKFYLDCANGILWDDDASVIRASAKKLYSGNPRVEIEVEAVPDICVSDNVDKIFSTFSPEELMEFQYYAEYVSDMVDISLGKAEEGDMEILMVSTANALSEFAHKFAARLTKIAKLGEIKSEIKEFEKFKACLKY